MNQSILPHRLLFLPCGIASSDHVEQYQHDQDDDRDDYPPAVMHLVAVLADILVYCESLTSRRFPLGLTTMIILFSWVVSPSGKRRLVRLSQYRAA
jgi:hypothetical protein